MVTAHYIYEYIYCRLKKFWMLTKLKTFTFQPNMELHLRMRSAAYALSQIARMLLPCWYGQRVIDQVMYCTIYLFVYPFIHSFVKSLICSFSRLSIHSIVHSFVHFSFAHSFVHSFIRLFIQSFIYLFYILFILSVEAATIYRVQELSFNL